MDKENYLIGLLGVVLVMAILVFGNGCATTPVMDPVQPQEIVVKVEGPGNPRINVTPAEEQYSKQDPPYLKLSPMSAISKDKKTGYIKIFSGLSVSDVTRMWNDLQVFDTYGIKKIKVFLNSPGGDAFAGMALSDLIEGSQKDGVYFEVYSNGIVASAAVPVYAVCDHRIAGTGTIFMVHEAALWKWPGRETASDIRSQNELMLILRDRYLQYLVRHSGLDLDQWREKEKATTWFDAEKAKDWGLVDEIR